jgi:hypothetical protein
VAINTMTSQGTIAGYAGYHWPMEKAQEERLALNEALFRDVNERIREISDSFGQKDATYDFLCECSDPMCVEKVVMTSAEYEYVRADPTRFVVAKGHVLPEVESVVDRAKDHAVVEKEGPAADIAIRLDRRS